MRRCEARRRLARAILAISTIVVFGSVRDEAHAQSVAPPPPEYTHSEQTLRYLIDYARSNDDFATFEALAGILESEGRTRLYEEALWWVRRRVEELRTTRNTPMAWRWLDIIDRHRIGLPNGPLLGFFAACERARFEIVRGAMDLAERRLDEARQLLDGARAAPDGRYALATLLALEADLAIANSRYQQVLDDAPRMRELLADEDLEQEFELAIGYRIAIAKAAIARYDPSRRLEYASDIKERFVALMEDEDATPSMRLHVGSCAASLAVAAGDLVGAAELVERCRALAADPRVATINRVWLAAIESRVARERGDDRAVLAAIRERLSRLSEAAIEETRSIDPLGSGEGILSARNMVESTAERIRLAAILDSPLAAFHELCAIQAQSDLSRSLGARRDVDPAALVADDRHLVLAYFSSEDYGHLFAIDSQGLEMFEVPNEFDLVAQSDEILAAMALGDLARVSARVREYGASFLPSALAPRLERAESISIAALSGITRAPFEVLEFDGEPLMTRFAIDFLPSLPAGERIEERRLARGGRIAATDKDLLLVATPIPAPSVVARHPEVDALESLAGAARQISDVYGAGGVARVGAAATVEALDEAGSARVVQIIAHGVFEHDQVLPAHLVLTPSARSAEGLYSCRDAASSPAPPLVVLASCYSGAGPTRRGNEMATDFSGAYLGAGAESVLLSNSRIEGHLTAALLARFHLALARGESAAEALRGARRWVADEMGEAALLATASLRLVGRAQRPVFDRPDDRWRDRILALAGVSLLALGLFVSVRRRSLGDQPPATT
jgi:hypothetical protein